MTEKNLNKERKAVHPFWFLLIGAGIIFILPVLFVTLNLFGISFTESGQIGDTIGGITAPFIGLGGAILVYISFREQVKANEKVQEQINRSHLESNFVFAVEEVKELLNSKLEFLKYYGRPLTAHISNIRQDSEDLIAMTKISAPKNDIQIGEQNLKVSIEYILPILTEIEKIIDLQYMLDSIELNEEHHIILFTKLYNNTKFLNEDYFIRCSRDISNAKSTLNYNTDAFNRKYYQNELDFIQSILDALQSNVKAIHKILNKDWKL